MSEAPNYTGEEQRHINRTTREHPANKNKIICLVKLMAKNNLIQYLRYNCSLFVHD